MTCSVSHGARRTSSSLLQQRPEAKAPLLGWQASTLLYHATRAHESGRAAEYREHYRRSLALFDEANRLDGENVGVMAVTGGSFVLLSRPLAKGGSTGWLVKSRIPPIRRSGENRLRRSTSYHCTFGANSLPASPNLPSVPAGLRRPPNSFEKIQTLLPDTPYSNVAQQWKESPESAATTSIACRTCHEPGRLAPRLAALNP